MDAEKQGCYLGGAILKHLRETRPELFPVVKGAEKNPRPLTPEMMELARVPRIQVN